MHANNQMAQEIEQAAVGMARGAGAILSGCFRQQISRINWTR